MKRPMLDALIGLVLGGVVGAGGDRQPVYAQERSGAAKIEWAASLDDAAVQAGKDGRPVIAYFTYDG